MIEWNIYNIDINGLMFIYMVVLWYDVDINGLMKINAG